MTIEKINHDYTVLNLGLACNSDNLKPLIDLGNQPLANSFHTLDENLKSFQLGLNHCLNCNHMQLPIAVNPKYLFEDYSYVSGTTKTLNEYFKSFVSSIEEKFPGKKLHVLDIACNDGSLLSIFKEHGHEVLGVDPAQNLRKYSLEKNIDVIVDFWSKDIAEKYKDTFDVIIAQNVLAHVSNPNSFLESAKISIKDTGLIAIQTSQYYMLKNSEFDTTYHEHHSFFCIESFEELAKRSKLNVYDAELVPIHGTSIVWYLSKTKKNTTINYKNLKLEEKKFTNPDSFNAFVKNTLDFKESLNTVVGKYRDKGFSVIGYGAAAKANTALNYAGVKLDFIIDDNPLKIGLYSPGMNIKVESINVLLEIKEPLLFVITAWNFADEIKQRILNVRVNSKDKFMIYFPDLTFL
jgi:2-polyprenyl-3-methyl-5-hydroxy-6-metoxy-1,4-benzoquinol methylase